MAVMSIRSAVRAAPRYAFSPHDQRVKLDQNESPYDLPAELRERALERVRAASFNRYPDMLSERIRERLAAFESWPSAGIVVANGSNVLIQALVIAAGIGQRVLTVTPGFPVYALQARLLGADLREVPLAPALELPIDALLRELGSGVGVHFLTDPMAPIGRAVPAGAVERLVEAGGDRWLSVIDEAYGPFAGSDHRSVVLRHGQAISLRTLSKAFALGGVRLGYALMDPALAAEVRKVLLPFAVSSLQAAVVETVLEEPGYVWERVEEARVERERMSTALAALPGVHVMPSVTNFLLLRLPDAAGTHAALLEAGIVVRRQDHLHGLAGCLRITVGAPHENDAAVAALADHLADRSRAEVPGAAG
jgi:histidinol-phosphate aminotransferase